MVAPNTTVFGDCREGLRRIAAAGITAQCCVTSPPYWRLRDYGVDGQIGQEETPAAFVESMVEVFALVRDVLADDGVLWLNLGDSYTGSWGAQGRSGSMAERSVVQARSIEAHPDRQRTGAIPEGSGLKPKDLVGIPWRAALALQAAGWYLRQDIIWHKPNPMPESVTDRCTKAHEYLFLLSKSERYYWDAEAMQERVSGNAHPRGRGTNPKAAANAAGSKQNASFSAAVTGLVDMRNRRSVWTVPTQPYSGAHFAVFPPSLIEPCVLATSRPGDVVLDPFMGSGTTAQVAQRLGRNWIGCELNPGYADLQSERTAQAGLAL